MTTLLWAVFAASLLGSLHCVGMCGGIVALCVGGATPEERTPRLLVSYNLGRLATYATLGLISGTIGRAVDLGGGAVGLPRLAAVAAGTLMIAAGVIALARTMGVRTRCTTLPPMFQRWLQRGMSAAMSQPPVRRSAIIGLLTGFLPCGWLYAFVAASATTGDPLKGAAVMTAFWLGTVPALVAVGFGVRLVARPLQRHLPALSAICMLAVGVVAVVGRLSVPTYAATVDARFASLESTVAPSSTTAELVDAASATPACCPTETDDAAPSPPPALDRDGSPPPAPLSSLMQAATAPPPCCDPVNAPGAAGERPDRAPDADAAPHQDQDQDQDGR